MGLSYQQQKANNPERVLRLRREAAARYRAAHPEKVRAGNYKNYWKNRERNLKYNRKYNADNRETLAAQAAVRLQQKIKLIRKAKDQPCADCGKSYPYYVMDLDHVRGTKVQNVANLRGRVGTEKLLEEIAKCDVVCANCHRERTFSRKRVTK